MPRELNQDQYLTVRKAEQKVTPSEWQWVLNVPMCLVVFKLHIAQSPLAIWCPQRYLRAHLMESIWCPHSGTLMLTLMKVSGSLLASPLLSL